MQNWVLNWFSIQFWMVHNSAWWAAMRKETYTSTAIYSHALGVIAFVLTLILKTPDPPIFFLFWILFLFNSTPDCCLPAVNWLFILILMFCKESVFVHAHSAEVFAKVLLFSLNLVFMFRVFFSMVLLLGVFFYMVWKVICDIVSCRCAFVVCFYLFHGVAGEHDLITKACQTVWTWWSYHTVGSQLSLMWYCTTDKTS